MAEITLTLSEACSARWPRSGPANLAEARRLYEAILGAKPEPLWGFAFVGRGPASERESQRALRLIDKALMIKPSYGEALNNRGIVLAALRRCQELQSIC